MKDLPSRGAIMGSEQQYCLKWNNHRSTILSVFDTLLEEESLVDVTLSADGQFLRAHRVILSACSPYFRTLFRSSVLADKSPVIILKDVDFDNLKALVEYMYKGEANVPQHMLPTFIKTAESLQIRGLAEGASKHYDAMMTSDASPSGATFPTFPSPNNHSTPRHLKERKSMNNTSGGGILAARLAQMTENPSPFLDFGPEAMLPRPSSHHHIPPAKKSRKSDKPTHKDESKKENKLKMSPSSNKSSSQSNIPKILSSNNNSYDTDEGVLKIDEDADMSKDNGEGSIAAKDEDNETVDLEGGSNGMESEDEEPSMPGPMGVDGGDSAAGLPRGLINPWTGEEMNLNYDAGDSPNSRGDTGLAGWQSAAAAAAAAASLLGEFSAESVPPSLPLGAGSAAHSRGPTPYGHHQGGEAVPSYLMVDEARISKSPGKKVKTNGNNVRLKRISNASEVFTVHGDKFRCKECSRCFNLKCTLLRHVRHQHQGRYRPHPCPECGQVFKRTDHLKVHLKKIHNIDSASRGTNRSSHISPARTPPVPLAVGSPASTASSTNNGPAHFEEMV